jgi:hypothetical protein
MQWFSEGENRYHLEKRSPSETSSYRLANRVDQKAGRHKQRGKCKVEGDGVPIRFINDTANALCLKGMKKCRLDLG